MLIVLANLNGSSPPPTLEPFCCLRDNGATRVAEGYGIPIVKALSLGTPVICSDIPVFREISQDKALLRSPIDGRGWLEAIESMMKADSALRERRAESP
jgi:glycosyltransferase involved in cell wall biosynthesis